MAKCVFCGDYGGSSIEVPYSYLPGISETDDDAEINVDLPVCSECASELSGIQFSSLEGASRYLASVYREIYAHLLSEYLWSSDELSELGYNLRTSIEQSHRAHIETVARVKSCEKVGLIGPEISEDIFDDVNYKVKYSK
jgi:hypothetical protein